MNHEQANKYADLLEEFVAAVLAKEVEKNKNGYTSESTDRTYYEARGAFVAALKAEQPNPR